MRLLALLAFLIAVVRIDAICPSICEDIEQVICAKEMTRGSFREFMNICQMNAANECNDRSYRLYSFGRCSDFRYEDFPTS